MNGNRITFSTLALAAFLATTNAQDFDPFNPVGPGAVPEASTLADIKTDLVAWYDFDDATDSHGSYDMSVTGAPDFATTSGAMEADSASGDYLNITTELHGLYYDPGATYGAFCGDVNDDGTVVVFARSMGASNGEYFFRDSGSRSLIRFLTTRGPDMKVNNVSVTSGGAAMSDNTDYMISIRVTGDAGSSYQIERFVDGVFVDAATGTPSLTTAAIQIPNGGPFRIYWLAFWNRKLTTEEIAALYAEGTSLAYADLP